MILMDVTILVYAHREETTAHPADRDWVEDTINRGSAYGVSELVLSEAPEELSCCCRSS